jgi:uncharacterized low-complexity protein
MRTKHVNPVAAAVGVALIGTAAAAQADALFALQDLGSGYRIVDSHGQGGGHDHAGHDMSTLDADGNGSVSQAEWDAAGKPADHWSRLDANSDGSIDAAEWEAHHKNGEGKCGEGKCGEGQCGGSAASHAKDAEGKCGEGKCGEGKCGEGQCGGSA